MGEDMDNNLFIPASVLLPEQVYQNGSQEVVKKGGTYRLMFVVLQDAVAMYQKHKNGTSRRSCRLFKETKEWFLSTDSEWLYSFENICDVFGLNAQAMREALPKMDTRAEERCLRRTVIRREGTLG